MKVHVFVTEIISANECLGFFATVSASSNKVCLSRATFEGSLIKANSSCLPMIELSNFKRRDPVSMIVVRMSPFEAISEMYLRWTLAPLLSDLNSDHFLDQRIKITIVWCKY